MGGTVGALNGGEAVAWVKGFESAREGNLVRGKNVHQGSGLVGPEWSLRRHRGLNIGSMGPEDLPARSKALFDSLRTILGNAPSKHYEDLSSATGLRDFSGVTPLFSGHLPRHTLRGVAHVWLRRDETRKKKTRHRVFK